MPLVGIMPEIDPALFPREWSMAVVLHESEKLISSYREWLSRYCAAFGIEYTDFGVIGAGYLSDGLHPSAAGHEKMADILCEKLNEMTER